MKVTVEVMEGCRRLVHVEVPAERVAAEFKQSVQKIAKTVQLPGFRPGRVPPDVVARRFTKAIQGELKEQLIQEAYEAARAQEGLATVALVSVKTEPELPETGKSLRVDITLDVAPSFTLPEYRGIPLQRRAVVVTPEQIEAELQQVRVSRGSIVEIKDRCVEPGDFVQLDFSGVMGGKSVVEAVGSEGAPFGEGTNFWALLNETEFLPGLTKGLAGAARDEWRQVEITFPAEFRVAGLAGKQVVYTIKVKQIRIRQPAAIDADFLKALGVESEEQLRAGIQQSLQQVAEAEERRRQRGELATWLLAHTDMKDLPASTMERETRRVLQSIVQENMRRGVPKEELEGHRDELYNTALQSSADRVKLDFILDRIADAEKIDVSDSELARELEQVAAQYRMATKKLREEMEKNNAMEGFRGEIRSGKTMQWLLSNGRMEDAA